MRLVVEAIWDEADGVRGVRLAPVGGGLLPPFEPGAHLELNLSTPGGLLVRRYSLAGDPSDLGSYVLGVLREPSSRGGSAFIHDALSVGDEVEAQGPFNEFDLDDEAEHSVLIAGGIGVTPLISMTHRLSRLGRGFEFHYAARTPERMGFLEPLRRLADQRLTTYVASQRERLDVQRLIADAPAGAHFYVCGPAGLIDEVRRAASELGRPAGRVHSESFGPKRREGDKPLQVRLTLSGVTLEVDPNVTILDAMIDAGMFVPYECKRGECGSCAASYSEGTPDHRDHCLTAEQRESVMCTCISRATTDSIALDL